MQNVGERKKNMQAHTPRIKFMGIKGLNKNFMPIPNHPTPPSEVKWLALKPKLPIPPQTAQISTPHQEKRKLRTLFLCRHSRAGGN